MGFYKFLIQKHKISLELFPIYKITDEIFLLSETF